MRLRCNIIWFLYHSRNKGTVLENMGVVLNNKGYQMIELFILLQLIQILTPGSNLINFYEDKRR